MVVNELASTYLHSTVAFGFSAGGEKGEPAPYSFVAAMHDSASIVSVGLKCKNTISTDLCNFDTVKPPQSPSEEPLIEV